LFRNDTNCGLQYYQILKGINEINILMERGGREGICID